MRSTWKFATLATGGLLLAAVVGCQGSVSAPAAAGGDGGRTSAKKDDAIRSAMAALNEADRGEAIAQDRCAVSGHPLGSMGAPLRVDLRGTSVFLCCKSCELKALAKPEATVAKAAEYKAANLGQAR